MNIKKVLGDKKEYIGLLLLAVIQYQVAQFDVEQGNLMEIHYN